MSENQKFTCANCPIGNCNREDSAYPKECLTTHADPELVEKCTQKYVRSRIDRKIALTAAQIEGEYYGRATRVEEILLFIKRMGYKKVGVATCVGLLREARIWANQGHIFGKQGAGFVRLNLALPRAQLKSALERLAQAVNNIDIQK